MSRLNSLTYTHKLCIILGMGFLLRVIFLIFGAPMYWGGSGLTNGDSSSFMGVINLLEHGTYTFDPSHPDARFGRVPVYPLFWGFHYLLFGSIDATLRAVSISQTLLDLASIWMLARLGAHIRSRAVGLWAAGLYACYPFAIVWVSITGTECFGTFLVLLTVLLCVRNKAPSLAYMALLGAMVGALTLTREYFGLLLPALFFYHLWRRFEDDPGPWRRLIRCLPHAMLLTLGFLGVFGLWPLRNIVLHDRAVLMRPENSGYHAYEADITRSRFWVLLWDNFPNPYIHAMTGIEEKMGAIPAAQPPDYAFADPDKDRQKLAMLVQRGQACGRGFYAWRTQRKGMPAESAHCTDEVAKGFDQLASDLIQARPLQSALLVPWMNIKKVLFKITVVEAHKAGTARRLLYFTLFGYRVVLVWVALIYGFTWGRRCPYVRFALLFYVSQVLVLCFLIRGVEMRYLLQFEVVLLVVDALAFDAMMQAGRKRLVRWKKPEEP